ncbi:MAG: phospholipase D-like domain-containing protein [Chloroflexota bacterium]|nr:MAG: phospholipase [Chloroflexota bacterium]
MTKRQTSKNSKNQGTSIGALIVVAIALVMVIISEITGVDLLAPVTETPPPTVLELTPGQPTGTEIAGVSGTVSAVSLPFGVGAIKDFWQVYFTLPSGSSDLTTYSGGIDVALASALAGVKNTLDIAAYEFNNPLITQAVLDAKARGVRVRVVTDNEDGLEDVSTTLDQLVEAGIPVVTDERAALMHNKFMILDGETVWTGSWNYTINGTYRNNNNALVLRSQRAVQNYQTEFDEMFAEGLFGPSSRANTPYASFVQNGVPIQIYFGPEDDVLTAIHDTLLQAQSSIHFMAFSFTLDELASAILQRAVDGVSVRGIFERVGSETQFSELRPLFCAGLDVRQDGNPYILHHKVFIVDEETVVTGSFNFSANATNSNDENLVIIQDADLAAQYLAEFERRWLEAVEPANVTCS